MDCPRCEARDVTGPECPSCGVILSRARPRSDRAPARPPVRRPAPSAGTGRAVLAVTLALTGLIGFLAWRRAHAPPASPEAANVEVPRPPAPPPDPGPGMPSVPTPELALPPLEVPADDEPLAPDTAAADQRTASRLAALLDSRGRVSDADIAAGEDLLSRYEAARTMVEALLVTAASQARDARQYAQAEGYLHRASGVAPGSLHPPQGLLAVYLDTGDWAAAERAARDSLALGSTDPSTVRGLAFALLRQDRSAEARELLEDLLERHPDPEARALLERLQRDVAPEGGLQEQRLAHFHVRYDGDAHQEVGRAVLGVLDRHYATLVRTFDHEPRAPIPVILLTRQGYEQATGAPGWSGGLYDSFDGRVRIPVGGLTASLTPELDGVVLHELTHAFVAERSGGLAPREIQEGLAQLQEGKTAEGLVGASGMRALADGRLRGVAGFYVGALSLVEHLMGQRGQGGINDLLDAMAETGNLDQAFDRVYGRDWAGVKREWQTWLRQRHGS